MTRRRSLFVPNAGQASFIALLNRSMIARRYLGRRARRRGFGLGLSPFPVEEYDDPFESYLEMRDRIMYWMFWFMRMCEEQSGQLEGDHHGMNWVEESAFLRSQDLDFQAQVLLDEPLMAQYAVHTNPWMAQRFHNDAGHNRSDLGHTQPESDDDMHVIAE